MTEYSMPHLSRGFTEMANIYIHIHTHIYTHTHIYIHIHITVYTFIYNKIITVSENREA